MNRPYDDIIDLPHHVSRNHPQMSRLDRAAQFAPFAALTGYKDVVTETARLTDGRISLDEDAKESLNQKLFLVLEHIKERPEIAVTYFVPDKTKSGGAYVTTQGSVKKYDEYERLLIMQGGCVIPLDEIIEIELEPD